ncbi:MAG: lamin tail domain-containing protein, partial [Ignavibacteriaceae bacterium]
SLTLNKLPWSGNYFNSVPITVSAIPLKGYKFSHWMGYSSGGRIIYDVPQSILNITAVFEPDTGNTENVVINEINYNSSSNYDSGDWIEFYNTSNSSVDLSGWIFKDEDDSHSFAIPEGTSLPIDGYIVICRDSVLFKNIYPDCNNFIGNFDFGFDRSGELLRLYDDNLSLIDSVHYDDELPWVTEPDGNGPTLSLINPFLDNSVAQSWKASLQLGTPGKVNDVYVSVNDNSTNLPSEFELEQNYPNPFNPSTTIRYSLKTPSYVKLYIYNLLGQRIRTLEETYKNAGRYAFIWDGKDDNNNAVSSGVYIYTLRTEQFNKQRKMILLR